MIDLTDYTNSNRDGTGYTTELTARDLAELLNMDGERLYGMLGPDVVATVDIVHDDDASAPDDWEMGCAAGVWTGGGDYIERDSVGDVPPALVHAIERYRAGGTYDHAGWGMEITERAMQRYAGLFGFTFVDTSFSSYRDSIAAVIVAKGDTANGVINDIKSEWQQWYDGDVWGVSSITLEGRELDTCWGFYGTEAASGHAVDVLRWAVEKRREEIIADKREHASV